MSGLVMDWGVIWLLAKNKNTMVFLDLASGIGRAVDEIEIKTTIFFACVILFQIIAAIIGIFRRTIGYKIFLRFYVIIPIAFSVFCFQHEVQHYIQGTVMLLLSVLSVLISFRK
jgi:hypothetical protein